ncbi:MAG TPA: S41 family peptidase [Woeseiaceae bacterium]|nr:S41 family peptidase [Woeseiaceae bacterium]
MSSATSAAGLLFMLAATGTTHGLQAGRLQGIWESEGYGRIYEVTAGTVNVFDVTRVSCVRHEVLSLATFLAGINRINLSNRDAFSYYLEGGITRYAYRRLAALPRRCVGAVDAAADRDPGRNFDVFWHSFDENYAFFAVRGVDWDALYGEYRPRVTPATSDDELFDIITEIVARIDDRHVLVERPGYPRRYSGHPGTLQTLLQKELPDGAAATRAQIRERAKTLIAGEYLGASRRQAGKGQFTWGWVAEGIGYFSIDSMEGYTPADATLQDSHRLVDRIMDRVIRDLHGARGIVVDARWNGGGYDSNALHIAGHFTDRQLVAFTKRARNGDSFTPEQEIFIPWHARNRYAGPLVYLCGRDTLSAAEIFSMAMMAMPNATSLGEPTVGSLSDTHSIFLPNGWRLQLSNEEYRAIDGVVYEGAGIPVDVALPPADGATLDGYIRAVLDAAIARLEAGD